MSAAWGRPGRLWSLWDIMKPFAVDAFLAIKEVLGNYKSFNLASQIPNAVPDMQPNFVMPQEWRDHEAKFWTLIRPWFEELDMDASLRSIDKISSILKNENATFGKYFELTKEFDGRLSDQMRGRHFLSLSLSEASAFISPLSGWTEIVKALPETQRDIEEARKCQALSRNAASIFHSLQVVEVGMIELGKEIGVTDHMPGWNATRAKLGEIIRKKHQERTVFEKENFVFIEQIQGTIESLNSAWRNKVSHANGKFSLLTADFTTDITEEILMATRSFMRRLVTEGPISKRGQPA